LSYGQNLSSTSGEPEFVAQKFFEIPASEHTRYLEWLHEGPEENPDGVSLAQQFHQPSSSEEAQETHVDEVFLK
jgi:hypothetical protein